MLSRNLWRSKNSIIQGLPEGHVINPGEYSMGQEKILCHNNYLKNNKITYFHSTWITVSKARQTNTFSKRRKNSNAAFDIFNLRKNTTLKVAESEKLLVEYFFDCLLTNSRKSQVNAQEIRSRIIVPWEKIIENSGGFQILNSF